MEKIWRGDIQTNGTLVTVDAKGNPDFQGTPSGSSDFGGGGYDGSSGGPVMVVVTMVVVVNQ